MKLERVMPWTSHAANSGLAISISVILVPFMPIVWAVSGEERLDRRQHRGHVGRRGEGTLRGDRLLDERAECRRVTRLDRVNRQRGREHFRVLDLRRLTEVGGGSEVLDRVGELGDLRSAVDGEL